MDIKKISEWVDLINTKLFDMGQSVSVYLKVNASDSISIFFGSECVYSPVDGKLNLQDVEMDILASSKNILEEYQKFKKDN